MRSGQNVIEVEINPADVKAEQRPLLATVIEKYKGKIDKFVSGTDYSITIKDLQNFTSKSYKIKFTKDVEILHTEQIVDTPKDANNKNQKMLYLLLHNEKVKKILSRDSRLSSKEIYPIERDKFAIIGNIFIETVYVCLDAPIMQRPHKSKEKGYAQDIQSPKAFVKTEKEKAKAKIFKVSSIKFDEKEKVAHTQKKNPEKKAKLAKQIKLGDPSDNTLDTNEDNYKDRKNKFENEYKNMQAQGHFNAKGMSIISKNKPIDKKTEGGKTKAVHYGRLNMDLLPGKTLYDFMTDSYFPEHQNKYPATMLLEIAKAMSGAIDEQLHERNFVHRDLSWNNILVDVNNKNEVTINTIDPEGLVKSGSHGAKFLGTLGFISPEYYNYYSNYNGDTEAEFVFTPAVDVYSFGANLAALWRFFNEANCKDYSIAIESLAQIELKDLPLLKDNQDVSSKVKQGILNLIKAATNTNPHKRPTMHECNEILNELIVENNMFLKVKNNFVEVFSKKITHQAGDKETKSAIIESLDEVIGLMDILKEDALPILQTQISNSLSTPLSVKDYRDSINLTKKFLNRDSAVAIDYKTQLNDVNLMSKIGTASPINVIQDTLSALADSLNIREKRISNTVNLAPNIKEVIINSKEISSYVFDAFKYKLMLALADHASKAADQSGFGSFFGKNNSQSIAIHYINLINAAKSTNEVNTLLYSLLLQTSIDEKPFKMAIAKILEVSTIAAAKSKLEKESKIDGKVVSEIKNFVKKETVNKLDTNYNEVMRNLFKPSDPTTSSRLSH